MSEVISFRLNLDNPREAQALEILRAKQAEGFSSRQVLTDALIGMEAKKGQNALFPIDEINKALERVLGLLEHRNGGNQCHPTHTQRIALLDEFIRSVKDTARQGMRTNL